MLNGYALSHWPPGIFFAARSRWEDNDNVTPNRAFWEAVATVCLPSLISWSILAYVLKAKAGMPLGEALPIYLFLAVFPLPLIYPIYRRYLKGPQPRKTHSRAYHVVWGVLYAAVAIAYVMPTLLDHKRRLGWWSQVAMAAFWIVMGIDHLIRAAKTPEARSTQQASQ